MNILRKLKISKLINIQFSETEEKILNLCDRKLRYLNAFVYDDKTVYCNLCNEFIFEANHQSKKLYVNESEIWNVIESKFGYVETQKLLSFLIKNKYEHYEFYYVMPRY